MSSSGSNPQGEGPYRGRPMSPGQLGLSAPLDPREREVIKSDPDGFIRTRYLDGDNVPQIADKLEEAGVDRSLARSVVADLEKDSELAAERRERSKKSGAKTGHHHQCSLRHCCLYRSGDTAHAGGTGWPDHSDSGVDPSHRVGTGVVLKAKGRQPEGRIHVRPEDRPRREGQTPESIRLFTDKWGLKFSRFRSVIGHA